MVWGGGRGWGGEVASYLAAAEMERDTSKLHTAPGHEIGKLGEGARTESYIIKCQRTVVDMDEETLKLHKLEVRLVPCSDAVMRAVKTKAC